MLREQLPQIFHPGRREGDGLLVVGTMDPEAAILWIHLVSQVPQELLVLAEHFGGAADGECESRRRHVRRRGRQASRGANSTAAVRPDSVIL